MPDSISSQHRYAGHEESEQELGTAWRWRCHCGQAGHWQYQTPDRCPGEHTEHVQRVVSKALNRAGVRGLPRPGRGARRR